MRESERETKRHNDDGEDGEGENENEGVGEDGNEGVGEDENEREDKVESRVSNEDADGDELIGLTNPINK